MKKKIVLALITATMVGALLTGCGVTELVAG